MNYALVTLIATGLLFQLATSSREGGQRRLTRRGIEGRMESPWEIVMNSRVKRPAGPSQIDRGDPCSNDEQCHSQKCIHGYCV